MMASCAGYRKQENGFTSERQKNALYDLATRLASTSFYLAKSSVSVSKSAILCFTRFLIAYDHELIPYEDIPDIILCEFVVWMALSNKHRSIRTYLSMGPRILVENWGIKFKKNVDRPRLYRILKSLDRIYGKATNRKTPVTIDMLRKMAKKVNRKSSKARRTCWCAILVAFFSLARKSAYCADSKLKFDPIRQLTLSDVRIANGRTNIILKRTKTIQTERHK